MALPIRFPHARRATIVLCLVVVGMFAVFVPVSFAQGGAIVVKEQGCNLIDASGDLFFDPTCDVKFVATPSGTVNASAHGSLPEGSPRPDSAVHLDFEATGIVCGTPFGTTTDWEAVVTPSGRVNVTCHIQS